MRTKRQKCHGSLVRDIKQAKEHLKFGKDNNLNYELFEVYWSKAWPYFVGTKESWEHEIELYNNRTHRRKNNIFVNNTEKRKVNKNVVAKKQKFTYSVVTEKMIKEDMERVRQEKKARKEQEKAKKKQLKRAMKDFKWTDKLVLEFCKVSTSGSYGDYSNAQKIEDKLKIFKQLNIK